MRRIGQVPDRAPDPSLPVAPVAAALSPTRRARVEEPSLVDDIVMSDVTATLFASRLSAAQARRVEERVSLFERQVSVSGLQLASASLEFLMEFCVSLSEAETPTREIFSFIHALDHCRVRAGGASWRSDDRYAQVAGRLRKLQPIGRRHADSPPFSLPALIQRLPRDDDFYSRRLRLTFLLRLVTMMRPSEPASISRKSICVSNVPGAVPPRKVVLFTYQTKQSHRDNFTFDTNHVEFLSPDSRVPLTLCPARQLLAWREFVDAMPLAQRHDSLFVNRDGASIKADTLRGCMTAFFHRNHDLVGDSDAHELRGHAAMFLLPRVPMHEIHRRAGWRDVSENRTLQGHYVRFRFVSHNFADCLLGLVDW